MLSRILAARRLPRTFAVRAYSDSRSEGSVAQSKAFNKKEKAHEDQYIHQHELEQLKKLKAQKQAEVDALTKKESEVEEKMSKK
ncbi:hypothetical protein B0H34DRAFT_719918 [Crassisporium funariophilum]|nr:hypothetical protein B0H34DRAFT_719918 [Crassisporium funariophilum]